MKPANDMPPAKGCMQSIDFQKLFERLPSPHMVLDREFRIVDANPAYERATKRSRKELIGRRLFDLFPNQDEGGRKLKASFQRVLDTGEADTLAYLPYDIPRPEEEGGGFEERYWTAVHVPLSMGSGEVTHILQNTVDVTEIVRIRQAASMPFRAYPGETQLIERAREAEEVQQSLLARSEDFRRVFQQAPGFIAVLMGPEHRFTFANDAYRRLVGRSVVGMTVSEALPEVEDQGFLDILDQVYSSGTSYSGEGVRLMLQRAPGERPRERFIDFSYEAIKDPDGSISGILVQGGDRTETVRMLRRQRLLLDELNHRVKNTLSSVQSIASHTLRSARDLPSAKKDFEARIIALSKAHNMLSAREWSDTELSALICQELSAHGRERTAVGGPSVILNPKASIAFAMLIHELSTNAAKYGSLSVPSGRVDVGWWMGDDDALELEWLERGGPAVAPPERQGFGTRMIERVITGELGGEYRSSYDAEGFSCRLTVPSIAYSKVQDGYVEPAR